MGNREPGGRCKIGIVSIVLIIVCVVTSVITWYLSKCSDDDSNTRSTDSDVHIGKMLINKNLYVHINRGQESVLSGQLWSESSRDSVREWRETGRQDVRAEWNLDRSLHISHLSIENTECFNIKWKINVGLEKTLKDCWNIGNAHWYGGYEDWYQPWPFEKTSRDMSAFVANDSYAKHIGGVQERYLFSTNGVGFYVDEDVPLFISINSSSDTQICFMAKYGKHPYLNPNNTLPFLNYHVCTASNVKAIHGYMSSRFIERPTDIPDTELFQKPIWSTWAQFHKDINQSLVIEFARDILENNFTHSQIEIDDDWTPKYGDMDFNVEKFPDARSMVRTLNNMGFRVTIWLHPFFNVDSKAFHEASISDYLIRQYDSSSVAIVSWWDGQMAGILDVSNREAVEWYLNKTTNLQDKYNISSFKFDAGETNWLPPVFSSKVMYDSPNFYPQKWAELAYDSDSRIRHQEVRVGIETQNLPIFVRMLDKNSNWEDTNGLRTLIPTALTFGILGYPFIIPDMIGGNAYDNNRPDSELFIRWMQANTFLPALQFSVTPWQYSGSKVVTICQKLLRLRENYTDTIINLAREATTTGNPIIRPLWWIAPSDKFAQEIDSEFLLGNDILVAPVLEKGAIKRDIYLPPGSWLDKLRGGVKQGGWYRDYQAALEDLPYFEKIN